MSCHWLVPCFLCVLMRRMLQLHTNLLSRLLLLFALHYCIILNFNLYPTEGLSRVIGWFWLVGHQEVTHSTSGHG